MFPDKQGYSMPLPGSANRLGVVQEHAQHRGAWQAEGSHHPAQLPERGSNGVEGTHVPQGKDADGLAVHNRQFRSHLQGSNVMWGGVEWWEAMHSVRGWPVASGHVSQTRRLVAEHPEWRKTDPIVLVTHAG